MCLHRFSKTVVNMSLAPSSSVELSQTDIDQGFCSQVETFPALSFDSDACVKLVGEMQAEINVLEDRFDLFQHYVWLCSLFTVIMFIALEL